MEIVNVLKIFHVLVKILQINYLQGGLKNVKKGSFGSACDFGCLWLLFCRQLFLPRMYHFPANRTMCRVLPNQYPSNTFMSWYTCVFGKEGMIVW